MLVVESVGIGHTQLPTSQARGLTHHEDGRVGGHQYYYTCTSYRLCTLQLQLWAKQGYDLWSVTTVITSRQQSGLEIISSRECTCLSFL